MNEKERLINLIITINNARQMQIINESNIHKENLERNELKGEKRLRSVVTAEIQLTTIQEAKP